jgi:hypothetical protein
MTRFKALSRSRQIIVAVVAVAILGCCGITGLALILPGDAEPTPTEAAMQPTVTTQPTNTPIPPTDTPIPPTQTAAPTDTPEPTDTPAPTDTPVPTDTPSPTETPLPTDTLPPTPTLRPTVTPSPTLQTPPPPCGLTPDCTSQPGNTPTLAATPEPTKPPEAEVVVDFSCCHVDAAGDDSQNPEDEWVCFRNRGDGVANMAGWTVVDEYGWIYIFPDFALAPGSTVRVITGCGTNTTDSLYWCKGGSSAVWNNDGDTVHLFDAAGNLVAKYSY